MEEKEKGQEMELKWREEVVEQEIKVKKEEEKERGWR